RGEVWFDNAPGSERVDWVLYHQRSQPGTKGNWRPFYTRVIELSTPTDSLLAEMDGFTAADIKKAEKKDQTICNKIDATDPKALCAFADFYDRFAAIKNLGPADRHWLERTAFPGKLVVLADDAPEDERHALHVFDRNAGSVRGRLLASLYAREASKEAQRKIGRPIGLLIWHA